ncbi:MAG: adenosylcobinamide-GDP ribazoletransferase [Alphaproteobacteria bacterium]
MPEANTNTDNARPWPGEPKEWVDDLRLAAGFLTRLPLPSSADRPLAQAARVFPLVGGALGLAAGLVYGLAAAFGLPPLLAAVATLACLIAATGALHEDGLADSADGLGGGSTAKDKLAIMRDHHIGAYGVIAVTLGLLARTAALAELAEPGRVLAALIMAGAASRAVLPLVMLKLSRARSDGLASSAGSPGQRDVAIGGGLALFIAVVAIDFTAALAALIIGALAAAGVAALARRQIGGYTGDILGAVQQAAEIAILATLVALL